MPVMGFEPTIPEFEREKTVHTLDRAAAVIAVVLHRVLHISKLALRYRAPSNILPGMFSEQFPAVHFREPHATSQPRIRGAPQAESRFCTSKSSESQSIFGSFCMRDHVTSIKPNFHRTEDHQILCCDTTTET
jgi:hypothetical protein